MGNKFGANSTKETPAEFAHSKLIAWCTNVNNIILSDIQKKENYLEIEGTQVPNSILTLRTLQEISNTKLLLSLISDSYNLASPKYTHLDMFDTSMKGKPKRVNSFVLPEGELMICWLLPYVAYSAFIFTSLLISDYN